MDKNRKRYDTHDAYQIEGQEPSPVFNSEAAQQLLYLLSSLSYLLETRLFYSRLETKNPELKQSWTELEERLPAFAEVCRNTPPKTSELFARAEAPFESFNPEEIYALIEQVGYFSDAWHDEARFEQDIKSDACQLLRFLLERRFGEKYASEPELAYEMAGLTKLIKGAQLSYDLFFRALECVEQLTRCIPDESLAMILQHFEDCEIDAERCLNPYGQKTKSNAKLRKALPKNAEELFKLGAEVVWQAPGPENCKFVACRAYSFGQARLESYCGHGLELLAGLNMQGFKDIFGSWCTSERMSEILAAFELMQYDRLLYYELSCSSKTLLDIYYENGSELEDAKKLKLEKDLDPSAVVSRASTLCYALARIVVSICSYERMALDLDSDFYAPLSFESLKHYREKSVEICNRVARGDKQGNDALQVHPARGDSFNLMDYRRVRPMLECLRLFCPDPYCDVGFGSESTPPRLWGCYYPRKIYEYIDVEEARGKYSAEQLMRSRLCADTCSLCRKK